MKEYLTGLIICSVAACMVCFISPSESLKGHQKFIAGLCIICVMVKPTVKLIDFIREFDITLYVPEQSQNEYEEKWEDYLEHYGEGAVKDYVSSELKNKFGVTAQKISVTYGDSDTPVIERIYIELPPGAVFKDTTKIEVYFENAFGCEVITAIG